MDYACQTFENRTRSDYTKARKGLTPVERRQFIDKYSQTEPLIDIIEFVTIDKILFTSCLTTVMSDKEFVNWLTQLNTEFSQRVLAAYYVYVEDCKAIRQKIIAGRTYEDILYDINDMKSHTACLVEYLGSAIIDPPKKGIINAATPFAAPISMLLGTNFRFEGVASVAYGDGVNREALRLLAADVKNERYTWTGVDLFKIGVIAGRLIANQQHEDMGLPQIIVNAICNTGRMVPPVERHSLEDNLGMEFISDQDKLVTPDNFEEYLDEFTHLEYARSGCVLGMTRKMEDDLLPVDPQYFCVPTAHSFQFDNVPKHIKKFFRGLPAETRDKLCLFGGGGEVTIRYVDSTVEYNGVRWDAPIAVTCTRLIKIPRIVADTIQEEVEQLRVMIEALLSSDLIFNAA